MHEVLSALDTREGYRKYRHLVAKNMNDPDLERVISNLDLYYQTITGDSVDWKDFSTWFIVQNIMLPTAKKTQYEQMFKDLATASTTGIKAGLVQIYLERYHAERIAFEAMKVAEGKKNDLSDVRHEFDAYMRNSGKMTEIEAPACMDDLDDLLTTVSPGSGISWRLEALRESLGDLRKGNLCLFNGRPESGKTTLMASEVTYMTPQLPDDEIALYFTNEEGGAAVKTRLYCSLLGVNLATLMSNPPLHKAEYEKALGGNRNKILVIDKHDLHANDIEYWLEKEKVGLVVIDQLRKVRGFEGEKGIQRLERLFQQAREWSKEYAPVLTVSQLDAQAEGYQYPTMDMLYESKTAVQGECDVIVNIGQVPGSIPQYARWLNVVKNKLPTPGDPMQRHGKHEVLMMPEIARYK